MITHTMCIHTRSKNLYCKVELWTQAFRVSSGGGCDFVTILSLLRDTTKVFY